MNRFTQIWRLTAALSFAAVGLLAPAASAASHLAMDSPSTSSQGNMPGRHDHLLMVAGMPREFIVYVPEKARGSAMAPVVMMLHGTSGDGEKFYTISGWREKADAEGLIAVFPTALVHCFHDDENRDGDFDDPGELKLTTKWNAGQFERNLPLCTAEEIAMLPAERRARADHPVADDMAFFRGLIDFLQTNYSIDRKRIYATGFSNGGQMTSRLAVEMSDQIAAAASHAAPLTVDVQASMPISFVLSYGNEDRYLTEYNDGAPVLLEEAILTRSPRFTDLLVGRWLTALQLSDTYTYSEGMLSGEKFIRFTYKTSTIGANNSFQLAFIDNLAHQYPNGDNHPISAARVLWQFFKDHHLP